ncbi:hypothetical protein HN876_00260 [archaeon]|jgi:hypothetical protein|nr:hypothetical protein [archaeon]
MQFVVNKMFKKIKISGKSTTFLVGILLLLIGLVGVTAFGGNDPSVMGHSGEEIIVHYQGSDVLLNVALQGLTSSVAPMECRSIRRHFFDSSSIGGGSNSANPATHGCDYEHPWGLGTEYAAVSGTCDAIIDDASTPTGVNSASPIYEKPIYDGATGELNWTCLAPPRNAQGDFSITVNLVCCK